MKISRSDLPSLGRPAFRGPAARRPRISTLLLGLALVFTLACGKEVVDEGPQEPEVLAVKTLKIGGLESGETREYPGQLAAWQNSEMAFEVDGRIVDWRFTEGQRVERGTILARLDPRDFASGLKAAEANMARAKADYLRYEKLFKEGVAAEAELEARQSRYEVRQAELEVAKKKFEDADLVAPFDGVVARKLVEDFENIVAKAPVLILQDVSRLKIKVTVPESDMTGDRNSGGSIDLDEINRLIRPRVVLTTLRARTFDAALHELALTADPVTRTFEATFVMENPPDVTIRPGMTAKVIIQTVPRGGGAGLTVPGVAVFADDEGQTHVWVIDPGSMAVSAAPVEVGGLTGERIAITSGLTGGETIAISGVQTLTAGQKVGALDARLR